MEQGKRVETFDKPAWMLIRPLIRVEKWASAVETGLNLAGASLIVFIMFFITIAVIMRKFFNSPIYGQVDVVEIVMAGVVFLGIAFTQKLHGHVRMGIFLERVTKGRAYHAAEFFTLFCALFGFIVFTICTLKAALYDLSIGGITPTIYLPTWPSKLVIPIGSAFICIRLIIQLIQHLSQAMVGIERRDL